MVNEITLRDFSKLMEFGLGGWTIVQVVTGIGGDYEFHDGLYFIVSGDELSYIMSDDFSFDKAAEEGLALNAEDKELIKLSDYYVHEIFSVAKCELPDHVLQRYLLVTKNDSDKALLRIAVVEPY